jgi:hypothetical protein
VKTPDSAVRRPKRRVRSEGGFEAWFDPSTSYSPRTLFGVFRDSFVAAAMADTPPQSSDPASAAAQHRRTRAVVVGANSFVFLQNRLNDFVLHLAYHGAQEWFCRRYLRKKAPRIDLADWTLSRKRPQ